MAALLNSTALRALLLAIALACVAALTAPAARGGPAGSQQKAADSQTAKTSIPLPAACGLSPAVLAEDWSWHEFLRFWERQAGSMHGVVGTVFLVAGIAVLMILWKGK